MDRDDLNSLVVENCGRSDKIGQIDTYLDFALDQLSKLYPFDALRGEINIDLPTNATQIQLPNTLFQIIELRLLVPNTPTLSYPMELHRKRWFVEKFPNVVGATISGRPLYCYREKNQLYLDRHANGDYNIRITAYTLDKFGAASDTPRLNMCYEAIVAYATGCVYKSIQMYDDAMFWLGEFNRNANLAMKAEQKEIGVSLVAQPWNRRQPIQTNEPWLDPFAGLPGSQA